MSIYKKFFNETVDENGKLLDIEIHYPDNFNFGYDVIDAIVPRAEQRVTLSRLLKLHGERSGQ